ncbi:hypothetical protein [Thiomicrorhabdus aquaedulcis]|nr:hypothetical protein [Thiomicrorhabdus aquaedulcis]
MAHRVIANNGSLTELETQITHLAAEMHSQNSSSHESPADK